MVKIMAVPNAKCVCPVFVFQNKDIPDPRHFFYQSRTVWYFTIGVRHCELSREPIMHRVEHQVTFKR